MQIHIDMPPVSLNGNPEMKALYDYLYKTAEYLNVVLNNIGTENIASDALAKLQPVKEEQ